MNIKLLTDYLQTGIGGGIHIERTPENRLVKLPLYLRKAYTLYDASLFDHPFVLAEPTNERQVNTEQTKKHFNIFRQSLRKDIALLADEMPAYKRKRLIHARMDFIVPGKQLFLPQLLIDLKENADTAMIRKPVQKLLPSAQKLIIFHLLNGKTDKTMTGSFKDLAPRLGYSAMAITKAVENLRRLNVIDVVGGKEKNIRFHLDRVLLWEELEKRELFTNPVLKKIFVDEKPANVFMEAGESALPHYSDLNPARQPQYALDKKTFYDLRKKNLLVNPNPFEGKNCLELWKYDPFIMLMEFEKNAIVDPLSLYLSLKGIHDERLEMALEQILNGYIYGKRT